VVDRNPERPDWCKQIDCPYYRATSSCVLRGWVIGGTSRIRQRMPIYEKYRVMAEENPEELLQQCRDRLGRI